MKTKIGFVAGAFKPYTKGHHFLITKASEACDYVYLYISTKDRIKKNEYPITWKQMDLVWHYVRSILPQNVMPILTENPTVSMFNNLLYENSNYSPILNKEFIVFTDDKDVNYIESQRVKEKLNNLTENNCLYSFPFKREKNINISATMARKALGEKDYRKFVELLPSELINQSDEIYRILVR